MSHGIQVNHGHVDLGEQSEPRIGLAAELTKRFDAILIGIAG